MNVNNYFMMIWGTCRDNDFIEQMVQFGGMHKKAINNLLTQSDLEMSRSLNVCTVVCVIVLTKCQKHYTYISADATYHSLYISLVRIPRRLC